MTLLQQSDVTCSYCKNVEYDLQRTSISWDYTQNDSWECPAWSTSPTTPMTIAIPLGIPISLHFRDLVLVEFASHQGVTDLCFEGSFALDRVVNIALPRKASTSSRVVRVAWCHDSDARIVIFVFSLMRIVDVVLSRSTCTDGARSESFEKNLHCAWSPDVWYMLLQSVSTRDYHMLRALLPSAVGNTSNSTRRSRVRVQKCHRSTLGSLVAHDSSGHTQQTTRSHTIGLIQVAWSELRAVTERVNHEDFCGFPEKRDEQQSPEQNAGESDELQHVWKYWTSSVSGPTYEKNSWRSRRIGSRHLRSHSGRNGEHSYFVKILVILAMHVVRHVFQGITPSQSWCDLLSLKLWARSCFLQHGQSRCSTLSISIWWCPGHATRRRPWYPWTSNIAFTNNLHRNSLVGGCFTDITWGRDPSNQWGHTPARWAGTWPYFNELLFFVEWQKHIFPASWLTYFFACQPMSKITVSIRINISIHEVLYKQILHHMLLVRNAFRISMLHSH